MPLRTLKKRSEFLRLRGGVRFATPSFVLETRRRGQAETAGGSEARFGFTVTKKLGGAVVRNRIRRRLKAALVEVCDALAKADHDYVVVARLAALDRDFSELKKDLERALHRVHHAPANREKTGGR